ncbi:MAG TPA: glycosyltransferase [bacterium]|nr:glycosyltransferase [bacterium]
MAEGSKPLKAAFLLNNLHGGGAERVALNLAEGFRREGWAADLLLARKEGHYLNQVPAGLSVHAFNTRTPVGSFFKLLGYLRRERPDVLFSFLPRENLVALLAKKWRRPATRFCVSEQNTPSEVLKISPWYYALAYRWTVRHLYPGADGLVAVSHGVGKDLHQAFGIEKSRIRVIYNPLIGPEVARRAAEALDDPWYRDRSSPLLLAVGRLEPQKDFFSLLNAFVEIRRVRPCRLLILGEGSLRGPLEARIRELGAEGQVRMPGFVDNPYAWMARADVMVLSSVTEGLCNVIAETVACGTTVVSTDCPHGPWEVLEGGRIGYLAPMGSPKQLAETVLRALESPIDPALLRKKAAEFDRDERIRDYARIAAGLCRAEGSSDKKLSSSEAISSQLRP